MLEAVHFGAGNIGRGFIGQILSDNHFRIGFVDINDDIIKDLNQKKSYDIILADDSERKIKIDNVYGLNNQTEADKVIEAISHADIITTSIGPNILPHIAELISLGIKKRISDDNRNKIDIIACENMIGGSQFLYEEVIKYLDKEEKIFVEKYIGFPNAAVDRIVPIQNNLDSLSVLVEPFYEWIIDASSLKNEKLKLEKVMYVENLDPYIERKLFSVNTGHATIAYLGAYRGYKTILESISDIKIKETLISTLFETGELLITKWGFSREEHTRYIYKIISRFENPYISDNISRVARTPIRKLGYNERFIKPLRELKFFNLEYNSLIYVIASVFLYHDKSDKESIKLQTMIINDGIENTIKNITKLEDRHLIELIKENYDLFTSSSN